MERTIVPLNCQGEAVAPSVSRNSGYLAGPWVAADADCAEDVIHYRYEIDAERHLVIATFFGDASLTDAQAIIAELYADPRHSPSMGRVYDCRAVTRMPPASELRAVAELFRRNVDSALRVRRAIVVTPGAYYGLARMLQALLDLAGLDVNLFTELDDALAWVTGRPSP